MTIKTRVARLEAKVGGDSAELILRIIRRVIDVADDRGELQSVLLVGGGRFHREADETEADFEARIGSE